MHRLPSVCLVRLVVITFKLDYLSSTIYSAWRHLFFNIWLTLWFWAVTWDLEAVIAVPVQVADAMTCDGAMRIVIRCKNYYFHGSAYTIMAIESFCAVATTAGKTAFPRRIGGCVRRNRVCDMEEARRYCMAP